MGVWQSITQYVSRSPSGACFLVGSVALAVACGIFLWTRWGQSRALEKCVFLSVLAHVLLALWAMRFNFAAQPDLSQKEAQVRVVFVEDVPQESFAEAPTKPEPSETQVVEAQEAPREVEKEFDLRETTPPEIVLDQPSPEPASSSNEEVEAPPSSVPNTSATSPASPATEHSTESMAAAEPTMPDVNTMVPMEATIADQATKTPREPAKRVIPEVSEVSLPAEYRSRQANLREALVQRHGGSAATEAAVKKALEWLARSQARDGRWDTDYHEGGSDSFMDGQIRRGVGAHADTGITGLALLAFLGAGHTHQEGVHAANVRRGLEYLLRSQAHDGCLAGLAHHYAHMYCHGIASLALAEAYGLTHDPALRQPLKMAAAYSLRSQHPTEGGWRYRPGERGDTSQFGWQVMALLSAERSGITIPSRARQGMQDFLARVTVGREGGLASYRPGERVTATMTAEAHVCRRLLRLPIPSATERETGQYLLRHLPDPARPNFYYWYYGTMALFQSGDTTWDAWNGALQQALLPAQRTEGFHAGSWDVDPVWGRHGGRVFCTSLGALCLEVYYRYAPLETALGPRENWRE